jgi:hypothetical protein
VPRNRVYIADPITGAVCHFVRRSASLLLVLLVAGCDQPDVPQEPPQEAPQKEVRQVRVEPPDPHLAEYRRTIHPDRLYLPTFMGKFGGDYFIVDCYNNRVLYSPDKGLSLSEWRVLDDDLSWPHSIASDGEYFVVDNTQAHEVRVYRRDGDGYGLHQVITDVGRRPHRTVYDRDTDAFYVLAAESQEMVKLQVQGDKIAVTYKKPLPFLEGTYARSFALIDDKMYFVSGPGAITVVDYRSDSYRVLNSFPVPRELASANDLHFTDGVYLVSATKNKLVRCISLDALSGNGCESIYEALKLKGNPYFFSVFDDRTHVSDIAGGDTIYELIDIGGPGMQARDLFQP